MFYRAMLHRVSVSASLQVQIVSSYPVRPTIRARMAQCAWRSWIRTISLWASAATVAGASLAPAVKSMWMSAAPTPVFTASAMTVQKKKKEKYPANMTLGMVASLHLNTHTHRQALGHICFCSLNPNLSWVRLAGNKAVMTVGLFHLMWGSVTSPAGARAWLVR